MSGAVAMRARALVRRHVAATVALGLFAGVAGGAALGVWGMARRTATSYERFTAFADTGTVTVFACPPGLGVADHQGDACTSYDYADILAFLHARPEVRAAGRVTMAITGVAPADDPSSWTRLLVPVPIDPAAAAIVGRPIVVAGRAADEAVASEAVVNEELRDRLHLAVGDQVVVTPYRMDEFDAAGEGRQHPGGQPTTLTVVGVVRHPGDLKARLGGSSLYEDLSSLQATSAWWQRSGGQAARYGVGVGVQLAPGATVAGLRAAMAAQWPGREIGIEEGPVLAVGGYSTVTGAIALQARGLLLVAALVGLAGLVFAGQAVARQARREWADAEVLAAIGMTRSTMAGAAALRASATAAIAVVVAAVVTVALSPFGPVGVGRAAEPHPGLHPDWLVVAVGLPLVALAVVAAAVAPVWARRRRSDDAPLSRSPRLQAALPPTGVAGRAMARSRRAGGVALGSAVVGVALATAAGVAAWSLSASYGRLVDEPVRFGAFWDAMVGNVGSAEQRAATEAALRAIPGISAVGVESTSGVPGMADFTLMALVPLVGDPRPGVVIAGRPPAGPTEVALGRVAMDRLGVGIGDTVHLPPGDDQRGFDATVVGEAVVNDGIGSLPGVGALVTDEAYQRLVGDSSPQTYAVQVDRGADRAATLAAVRAAFPTTYVPPEAMGQTRNLGLVRRQPLLLAAIVGLFAGAALVHALVLSVRRGRRQIGVLKSVGFTRGQVVSSVAWHATLLAVAALVVGVPLGIVGGRVAWAAIVDGLGLASPAVLPVAAIVGVSVLVLAVANLAALGPGWAAARTRPAASLRTE